jgi:hypothetical protein
MNKSKEYMIFDAGKFHNPFMELDNAKSDTYEKRIVISPINSNNQIVSARLIRINKHNQSTDNIIQDSGHTNKLLIRKNTSNSCKDLVWPGDNVVNSIIDDDNEIILNVSMEKKVREVVTRSNQNKRDRDKLIKEK